MAFRVMKTADMHDVVYYRIACSCQDPECDITLELQPFTDEISLTMWMNAHYHSWKYDDYSDHIWLKVKSFWRHWARRLGGALRLLFTGYISLESEFLFENATQIYEFLDALEQGGLMVSKTGTVRVPLTILQLNELLTVISGGSIVLEEVQTILEERRENARKFLGSELVKRT
jgi:hypothetical protein